MNNKVAVGEEAVALDGEYKSRNKRMEKYLGTLSLSLSVSFRISSSSFLPRIIISSFSLPRAWAKPSGLEPLRRGILIFNQCYCYRDEAAIGFPLSRWKRKKETWKWREFVNLFPDIFRRFRRCFRRCCVQANFYSLRTNRDIIKEQYR